MLFEAVEPRAGDTTAAKESLGDALQDHHWSAVQPRHVKQSSLWRCSRICAMNDDATKCLRRGDSNGEVVRDLDVDGW
jgi:hypothetical protein